MQQTFRVNVGETKDALLAQEDTDRDGRITVVDKGPKVILLPQDPP
jgi:hypothetical protein